MNANDRAFWRAHDQYYALPDEDEFDTCQVCIDGMVNNPDFDPNEANPEWMEPQTINCDACDGEGMVNVSELDRAKRREWDMREHDD